jgi:hypothetical protein
VGAHGPKHGRQRRKNTPSQLNARQQWIADQIRQREDEEEQEMIDRVLRSTEHGFIHRKYGE